MNGQVVGCQPAAFCQGCTNCSLAAFTALKQTCRRHAGVTALLTPAPLLPAV